MILSNSYVIAIIIPLILIFCGAIAKKIVRGDRWRSSDFFLGVELSLTTFASTLLYLYDLQEINRLSSFSSQIISPKLTTTITFLIINFFIFLWILSIHQDWIERTHNPYKQFIWLGIITNSIGITLFIFFVIFVKGF